MREIEFRGIGIYCDSKKQEYFWHYGSLYVNDKKEYYIDKANWKREPVKPETVGQYIGERDKNRKKIYERNIVKFSSYDFLIFVDGSNKFILGRVEYDNGDFLLNN